MVGMCHMPEESQFRINSVQVEFVLLMQVPRSSCCSLLRSLAIEVTTQQLSH